MQQVLESFQIFIYLCRQNFQRYRFKIVVFLISLQHHTKANYNYYR